MRKRMTLLKLLINLALLVAIDCYIVDPGPKVIATKGEVWPKPYKQDSYDSYYILRPQIFQFKVTSGNECSLLEDAFGRYHKIIAEDSRIAKEKFKFENHVYYKTQRANDVKFLGYLDTVNVSLNGACNENEYPSSTMDEAYELTITPDSNVLSAGSVWGILRGLETLTQLLYADDTLSLKINVTTISDSPRYSHRGLLVDTARHFIPLEKILLTLDAMAYNKMNVFHWHITDDQSFPYVSKKYPELSEQGAYTPYMIYTPSDIREVLEYARIRGIRVIPEFDTPGHTRSWGIAKKELLTECYEDENKTGKLGPIDPTKNATYEFLENFFKEVGEIFPDKYIHLGGDEVGFECWESNPDIKAFMDQNNISENFVALESLYIQKLINIVNQLNSDSVVWEEVFVNGVVLPNETVVHVWKDVWQFTLSDVTLSGRQALLSTCWYLDHLSSDGDWVKFYECEPSAFVGDEQQQKLLLGGEACMWSEVVNEYNIISRVWPRASATAEKLWSAASANDTTEAARRLEEHTCRMNRRGIGAQPPNAAGYCQ